MLKVTALTKIYPGGFFARPTPAVRDVSFELLRGESLAVIGESGSGKTTVARMISRLLEPTAGEIVFDGVDIGRVSPSQFIRHPARRQIQHVFQDAGEALTPHLTIFDAIAEPLRRLVGLRNPASRVRELADAVFLTADLLSRYPHQLSGGQRARVGIARALACQPRLIVLDEPTASLDVSVQAGILKLLDGLRVNLGLSFLLVTHDIEVVRLMCSKLVLMQHGSVIEQAATKDFLAGPASDYGQSLLRAVPRLRAVGQVRQPPPYGQHDHHI
jgi:peptide/nickel transport system ATP-binding protein